MEKQTDALSVWWELNSLSQHESAVQITAAHQLSPEIYKPFKTKMKPAGPKLYLMCLMELCDLLHWIFSA